MKYSKNATNWDYESVKEYIESYGARLISDSYKNMREKIIIECRQCKKEYSISFYSFVKNNNKICKKCSTKNVKPYKYSIPKIQKLAIDNGCELLSDEYMDVFTKLKFRCSCGNVFETNINEFVNCGKTKCNSCGIKSAVNAKLLNIEDVRMKVSLMSDCELLSDTYISAHEKLRFKCGCGEEFERSWANFTNPNKRRCKKCCKRESSFEKEVRLTLEKLNIKYKPQYAYKDCLFKSVLPFDFYLPDYNCCIEVDGQHHFRPVNYFGGIDAFKIQKERDRIKTEYCKNKGILLIRIPYFNIKKSKEIILNIYG